MPKAFDTDLFAYLNDLAANNEREWFNANKKQYEHSVKEPALDFIESFRPRLADISPHFEANARVVGGSLFRINRDTRFSKDKTPYKIHTGMQFRHERAKDVHAPGFYLHLQPRQCFMGSGLWHPEPKVANQIRGFIADHRDRWTEITSNLGSFQLAGDSLKRPPRGFEADDPLIDDLKRKDFMTTAPFTHKQITSASFPDLFEARCRESMPFLKFLCDALELEC
jgi:uncharacterized protein (TIGR02453 family)